MGNYYVPNKYIVLEVTRTLGRRLLSGANRLTFEGETGEGRVRKTISNSLPGKEKKFMRGQV